MSPISLISPGICNRISILTDSETYRACNWIEITNEFNSIGSCDRWIVWWYSFVNIILLFVYENSCKHLKDAVLNKTHFGNTFRTLNHWNHSSIICLNPKTYKRSFAEIFTTLMARFVGPTWGPPGADRTQIGPMLAPWSLESGHIRAIFLTFRTEYNSVIIMLCAKFQRGHLRTMIEL